MEVSVRTSRSCSCQAAKPVLLLPPCASQAGAVPRSMQMSGEGGTSRRCLLPPVHRCRGWIENPRRRRRHMRASMSETRIVWRTGGLIHMLNENAEAYRRPPCQPDAQRRGDRQQMTGSLVMTSENMGRPVRGTFYRTASQRRLLLMGPWARSREGWTGCLGPVGPLGARGREGNGNG